MQVLGAAAGLSGRRLAGVPQERQEDATSVGLYREVAAEGGGGSIRLGKALLRNGTCSAAIWGGDLGDVRSNGEET